MPYSIEILRAADKFLARLSKQQPSDSAAIENAIERLAHEPFPPDSTILKGYQHIRRIRVGNYRVCYQVRESRLLVLVITISTRDNVYEVLRRHLGR